MSGSFVSQLNNSSYPDPNENIFTTVWNEYERVIIKSLITSFGLDFLVKDQYGGDVDTINNVRQIGKNSEMTYKNKQNKSDYDNRGDYNTADYHSDERYRQIVREAKSNFNKNGIMVEDAYVGGKLVPARNKTIPIEKQAQLDHVIAAEQIHNDPGRILAGLDGKDLANNDSNLRFTNACLNRNMSNMSMDEYIQWCRDNPDKVNWNGKKGEPLPAELEEKLKSEYARAKKDYDKKIENEYYTSPKFMKDTAKAAATRGLQMGLRQALGFVFVELWMSAKEELQSVSAGAEFKDMLNAVISGVKKGIERAKNKYKELLQQFESGLVSGILAGVTTTICNIFFTTAKNLVRCIRQIYASVVEAGSVLLFNPDNLMFGDRIKTASVIMATGASVLVGTVVGELIEKTPIGTIPVVGNAVSVFCSTLVSGLLSCTLLIFLDRSRLMNNVINAMNRIPSEVNNFMEIADTFELLAAKIENIDIEKFREDTECYRAVAIKIENAASEYEINETLVSAYETFGIKLPWNGDFDSFMGNKGNKLVFE